MAQSRTPITQQGESSAKIERLQLSGEFDFASKDRLAALLEPCASAKTVIIDLSDVTYLDSTALGCFVWLRKLVRERSDGNVYLTGLNPQMRRLFTITGLDLIFQIDGHQDDGKTTYGESS